MQRSAAPEPMPLVKKKLMKHSKMGYPILDKPLARTPKELFHSVSLWFVEWAFVNANPGLIRPG